MNTAHPQPPRVGRMVGPGQHANLGGDVAESDRLRPLFFRWLGNRSQATGLRLLGIDYGHGMRWAAGGVLGERYHQAVRDVVL